MNFIRGKLVYYFLVVLGVLLFMMRGYSSVMPGWAWTALAFLSWVVAAVVSYRYVRCPHCGQQLLRSASKDGICPRCGKRL